MLVVGVAHGVGRYPRLTVSDAEQIGQGDPPARPGVPVVERGLVGCDQPPAIGHELLDGLDLFVAQADFVGKAEHAKHAELIIRNLFSSPHKIITAVALVRLSTNFQLIETAVTIVYPRRMTEQQISTYISTGRWMGKAGAYGIQETGDEFIEKIEGSFTNVMGLPMELVQKMLKEHLTW